MIDNPAPAVDERLLQLLPPVDNLDIPFCLDVTQEEFDEVRAACCVAWTRVVAAATSRLSCVVCSDRAPREGGGRQG